MVNFKIKQLLGTDSFDAAYGKIEYGKIILVDGKGNEEVYQVTKKKYDGLKVGYHVFFDETSDVVRKVFQSKKGEYFNATPRLTNFVPITSGQQGLNSVVAGGGDDEDVDSDDEDSEPIID